LKEETHYQLLKLIEENPEITQREMAREMGVSLGKANYCLKALLEQGWIKANNFRNSHRKWAYVYLLTPSGLEQKFRLTGAFLKRKLDEHETLKLEIARLQADLAAARNETAKPQVNEE
jgi:EPS-associated MarR family transcriptional regulator